MMEADFAFRSLARLRSAQARLTGVRKGIRGSNSKMPSPSTIFHKLEVPPLPKVPS